MSIQGDVFRKENKELSEEQASSVLAVKEKAAELLGWIDVETLEGNSREMGIARTKLEECVMWATKGITR